MSKPFTVACYYFPNYHPSDRRNNLYKGPGWCEWELVRQAKARFPGHRQPKRPAWGETDESDPVQMAQKISAAADHGIDAFIFDWYYYNDGPFLERALDAGFLKATNSERLKFALMWANHDWIDIHPWKAGTPRKVLYPGVVTPKTWDEITNLVIERYFSAPNYWNIDQAPYFSIYELSKFIENFGSVAATRTAIDAFRTRVRAAGHRDLHMNLVLWGRPILPGETTVPQPEKLALELGFDSITSYVWIHHAAMDQFPTTEYDLIKQRYMAHAQRALDSYPLPYYPNVSMGWDASPRCSSESPFQRTAYPFTPVLANNTPAAFKQALIEMRTFLEKNLQKTHGIFNLNCWNEWTEGSYLEPDTDTGMAYLEALREVFGSGVRYP